MASQAFSCPRKLKAELLSDDASLDGVGRMDADPESLCSRGVKRSRSLANGCDNAEHLDRISASELSARAFSSRYVETSTPCLITDAQTSWPAVRRWQIRRLLKLGCGRLQWRIGDRPDQLIRLQSYLGAFEDARGSGMLPQQCIFDSAMVDVLAGDYAAPSAGTLPIASPTRLHNPRNALHHLCLDIAQNGRVPHKGIMNLEQLYPRLRLFAVFRGGVERDAQRAVETVVVDRTHNRPFRLRGARSGEQQPVSARGGRPDAPLDHHRRGGFRHSAARRPARNVRPTRLGVWASVCPRACRHARKCIRASMAGFDLRAHTRPRLSVRVHKWAPSRERIFEPGLGPWLEPGPGPRPMSVPVLIPVTVFCLSRCCLFKLAPALAPDGVLENICG
eukprot:2334442-Pleurochrysis_carterae.AAC.1